LGVSDSCPAVPLCFNREVCFHPTGMASVVPTDLFFGLKRRAARAVLFGKKYGESRPAGLISSATIYPVRFGSFDRGSRMSSHLFPWKTRIFLRDIDSDELLVNALTSYCMLWAEGLQNWSQDPTDYDYPYDLKREIYVVIKDLGDRKKRLRDAEFLSPAD